MLSNNQPVRDVEGYVLNPEDWDRDFARKLAGEEELELDQEYWQILDFMRRYWEEHKIAPDVRHVIEYLANQKNWDKKKAKRHLFSLFPYGYVKQACKLAGMQRPRAWSTG